MIQQDDSTKQTLATVADGLNSILRTHMVEGEPSHRLPYDVYTGPMACVPDKTDEAKCSLRKVNKKK